jgi:hypothetical protein
VEDRETRRGSDTLLARLMDRMHRSILRYSPKSVYGEFSEVRGGVRVVTSCSSVERGRTR